MASQWGVIRGEARLKSNDNVTPYRTADVDALTIFNNLLRQWKAKTDNRTRELSQSGWATSPFSAVQRYVDSTIATMREILRCYIGVTGSPTLLSPRGAELEYVEPWEMQMYYDEDADPSNTGNAAAARWTYRDLASASGGLGLDVGTKRVWIHPMPTGVGSSGVNYILDARMEPSLVSNDTDVPDVTDFECAGLGDALAYELARRMGWGAPTLESIRSAIPEEMQFMIQAKQQSAAQDRPMDGVRY